MRRYIFPIIAVAIAGILIWFFLIQRGTVILPSDKETKSADAVFALSFKDYDGNAVSLADFRGKPLVVNGWAVWCPFCVKELGDFAIAQKEFGDKVTIIAIDRAESLETAKKFTDDLGVTDDLVFWLDSDDSFYRSIGGFSMPETIFIDSDGNKKFHKRGPMDAEEIINLIQTHIL